MTKSRQVKRKKHYEKIMERKTSMIKRGDTEPVADKNPKSQGGKR